MSNYIDASYITARTDEAELQQILSDDDVANSPVLLQAIIDAESFVNESLENLYTVPLTNPSSTIKKIAYYLAIYNMYSFRYQSDMPDNIIANNKYAIKYLDDVRDGKIKIYSQTELEVQSSFVVTNKEASDKIFDSTKLGTIL